MLLQDTASVKNMLAAVMNPDYTAIGGSFRVGADTTSVAVDIYLAKTYTNAASVAQCSSVQYFGTSICVPTADEITAFDAQNSIRTTPSHFDT